MSAVTGTSPQSDQAFDLSAPAAPTVPAVASRADRILPIVILVSLIVHLTIFLPSLLGMGVHKDKPAPKEIPVELVQLPPPPPPKPPPQAHQQAAPKPPPKQQAEKKPEPPKPQPKPTPAQQSVAQRMRKLLPISSGALAMPGSSADGGDSVSYEDLVLSKVAKAKDESRHKGDPASATVAFLLDDKGDVASVMITQASGNAWLDDEAIAMIRRGAPYPPPPPGAKRDFQVTLFLHRV